MRTLQEWSDMLEDCLRNPVDSRQHVWYGNEESQYVSLDWRGRWLYDNLRTKYNIEHHEAYDKARMMYGLSPKIGAWNEH